MNDSNSPQAYVTAILLYLSSNSPSIYLTSTSRNYVLVHVTLSCLPSRAALASPMFAFGLEEQPL